jgi:hypothetical protein
MNSIQRVELMFEDINGKFDFLVEAIGILQKDLAEMKPWVACIPGILQSIDDIKLISREHSLQLRNHEVRITRIEAN